MEEPRGNRRLVQKAEFKKQEIQIKGIKWILLVSGLTCFVLAIFQVIISFSPALSLYFGAPEALTGNRYWLIIVSLAVAGILILFGCYALSGAGVIRALPGLKPGLCAISLIFILRGLLVIPEALVVMGVMSSPIPVPPRFVVFSAGALVMGILFTAATIWGWPLFLQKGKQRDFIRT